MPEQSQFKVRALEFGHDLQRAFRTAVLYSAQHSATETHLQKAYSSLNDILKQSGEFTLGFLNKRVVLNNIVTTDSSLSSLEGDFSKRGIRGVTFAPGITFHQFKRGISLLTTKPSVIQQEGGFAAFLMRNSIEGMQVLSAEIKTEQKEDAVLETDAQSYLKEQTQAASPGGFSLPGLNLLLRLGGSFRSAGQPAGQPADYAAASTVTSDSAFDLVRKATEAAIVHPESSSPEVVGALARVLKELTPKYLLSPLPHQRQAELCGLAVEEIAAELTEDIFIQWAANQLATAAPGAAGMNERREVARVLNHTVTTAEAAERLRLKLARLLQSAQLPKHVHDQIDQELTWNQLPREEKHARLMALKLFSEADFFHLISFVQDSGNESEVEKARELALHYSQQYFASVHSAPAMIQEEWLVRVPELLEASPRLHSPAWTRVMAVGLCQELLRESSNSYHSSVASYLSGVAQSAATYEDYETALKIGLDLERSQARDLLQHDGCCLKALGNLLTSQSVESLIECSLQKPDDPATSKTILSLLKLASAQVSEIALELIDKEADVPKRMRVLRLAARLGPRAIEAVRKHLADDRWYMVRNAVSVLAGLGDPDLPQQMERPLCHSDSRVQQATVNALAKSNHPARGKVLAGSLPHLPPHLQEAVLDALVFLRDPATVAPLEEFLLHGAGGKAGTMGKALQVLTGIPGEAAEEALGKVLLERSQAIPLRKSALAVLLGRSSARTKQILAEFERGASTDPLASEFALASSAKPA